MVLVDTSVWIRFLSNRQPYKTDLDRLLAIGEVAGHELIYGELLIGDNGSRRKFLAAYESIHQAKAVLHQEVVQFARTRHIYGRGVGWIDTHLLASALVSRLKLWTVDSKLAALATKLGVAWH